MENLYVFTGTEFNFAKYSVDDIDSLGLPYDYGSVMHYEGNAFTSNGQPTIIAKRNITSTLGQRVGMSPIDISEVQRYYGCLTAPTPSLSSKLITSSSLKLVLLCFLYKIIFH